MRTTTLFIAAAFAVCASLIAFAAEEKPRGPVGGKRGGQRGTDAPVDDARFLFRTEVPAQAVDVILGRPTKHSMTASVLAYADREGIIQYGPKAGAPAAKTAVAALRRDTHPKNARCALGKAAVDYFRAYPADAEAGGCKTGAVTHTYTVQLR